MAKAKSDYNPKLDARDFMKEAIEALKDEARKGKGIARLQAIAQLVKLAEPEAMNPNEDDAEIEETILDPEAPPPADA